MAEPATNVSEPARADLYTPLAVYLKLANGPYSYLLESVVGGERFGRYSFIGLSCTERIEARGRTVRRLLRDARGADVCLESVDGDPFEYVRAWLARNKVAPTTLRFAGGLAGYFGYEAVRHIEPRALGAEKRLGKKTQPVYEKIRARVPFIEEDTLMYPHIEAVKQLVKEIC